MASVTLEARKAPAALPTPEEAMTVIMPGFFVNGLPAGNKVTESLVMPVTLKQSGVSLVVASFFSVRLTL
jgi:hypothetical protein